MGWDLDITPDEELDLLLEWLKEDKIPRIIYLNEWKYNFWYYRKYCGMLLIDSYQDHTMKDTFEKFKVRKTLIKQGKI